MAPPRRILRQQCEILLDFLEENKEYTTGLPVVAPGLHQAVKQKWAALAKQLNAVRGGAYKTPDVWRKYWFEWRHKIRKKAADVRRFQSGPNGTPNKRFVPLNDLEVRVLELSGKTTATTKSVKKQQNFLAEDLDTDQNNEETKLTMTPPTVHFKGSNTSRMSFDDDNPVTPPPKWALQIEERRVAAEERIAEALESIVSIMRTQEERRGILEERVTDALSALAGTVQDLNSGVQEAVNHLQRLKPSTKEQPAVDVFLTE